MFERISAYAKRDYIFTYQVWNGGGMVLLGWKAARNWLLIDAEELRIPKMSLDTKVFVELIANQSFPSTV